LQTRAVRVREKGRSTQHARSRDTAGGGEDAGQIAWHPVHAIHQDADGTRHRALTPCHAARQSDGKIRGVITPRPPAPPTDTTDRCTPASTDVPARPADQSAPHPPP